MQDCSNSIANALELQSCVYNIHGLAEDCRNSIANALELLQSCAKPLIHTSHTWLLWDFIV